ncbi:serine/threonine protein kinase [Spiractinospora alimapuensis]|uniref:serine/threonine protein kinase n=1 Tax=Spiractinospora alimapuensis TaxID=2820884 RepID=UPI001F2003CD|nr:serine/threonine-protein kinase [Spiractinospora alimapuensis]
MANDAHAPTGPGGVPAELAPLAAGDPATIGPYAIVGRLGSGGMGSAYGGVDAAGRCVIVTTIDPDPSTGVAARELLGREVARLRGIDGVCVPRVRAAEPDGLTPWMATDFVAGNTLGHVVRTTGPLSDSTLMCLAAGTAEALTAIHAAGVVHRAVSPETVILAPDGPRVVGIGAASTQTDDGTPGWSAPEAGGDSAAAAAGDVFSWGAVMAFAATGREPFGAGGTVELRRRIVEEEPDLAGLPAALRDLVTSALAKDPRSRPAPEELLRVTLARMTGDSEQGAQSRTALKGALRGQLALTWTVFDAAGHDPAAWARAAAQGSATAASEAVAGDTSGGRTRRRRPLRALLITVIVLVVLAVLGVGGYLAYDRLTEEESAAPGQPDAPEDEGPEPREIVFEASETLLNADTFEAETQERPIDDDSDLETRVITQQFTASPEPTFVAGIVADDEEPSYVSTADGELLEYDPGEEEWVRDPEDVGLSRDFPGPAPYTAEELIAPLQRMAEADDLRVHIEEQEGGVDTVVYTGSFDVQVPNGERDADGAPVRATETTDFQVRIDENGHPIRSFYTRGPVEVRTEYVAIDDDLELGYPWDELPDDLEDIPNAEDVADEDDEEDEEDEEDDSTDSDAEDSSDDEE